MASDARNSSCGKPRGRTPQVWVRPEPTSSRRGRRSQALPKYGRSGCQNKRCLTHTQVISTATTAATAVERPQQQQAAAAAVSIRILFDILCFDSLSRRSPGPDWSSERWPGTAPSTHANERCHTERRTSQCSQQTAATSGKLRPEIPGRFQALRNVSVTIIVNKSKSVSSPTPPRPATAATSRTTESYRPREARSLAAVLNLSSASARISETPARRQPGTKPDVRETGFTGHGRLSTPPTPTSNVPRRRYCSNTTASSWRLCTKTLGSSGNYELTFTTAAAPTAAPTTTAASSNAFCANQICSYTGSYDNANPHGPPASTRRTTSRSRSADETTRRHLRRFLVGRDGQS